MSDNVIELDAFAVLRRALEKGSGGSGGAGNGGTAAATIQCASRSTERS
jgi:hypothetical protein